LEKTSAQIIDFTLLYNKHKKGLYNFACKMLSDKLTAEDLIHTIFLRLFENIDKLKNPESVAFWLYRSLRNEIYMIYRSKKIKNDRYNVEDVYEIEKMDSKNIESEIEMNDIKEIIKGELDKIDKAQKEVFLLKEYGKFSYKEIAEIMDINENLVKSRLFKTRQKLIERMSKIIDKD